MKDTKQNPKPDDEEQSQRFVDTARQLGVDESGRSFERAFISINPQSDQRKHPEDQSSQ